VLADVQAQKGSLGKFVYDPGVYDQTKQFVEKGNAFLSDVRAGKGTLGKLATDDSLFQAWQQTGKNLDAATEKLNQTTSTAGKFFSDPQFYDNLSGLAGDMRLLVSDFRQNPKKFLRVKFSIF
jgi:phospholipid/cholesterol/gamma-HCH transport system substrate-binding protein